MEIDESFVTDPTALSARPRPRSARDLMIGAKGLTETVLREIDTALDSHELIQIKDSSGDKTQRQAHLKSICDTTACQRTNRR